MLQGALVAADLQLMLDELLLPLHLAFDLQSGGQAELARPALLELLQVKCPEWGMRPEATGLLLERVATNLPESVPWGSLCR